MKTCPVGVAVVCVLVAGCDALKVDVAQSPTAGPPAADVAKGCPCCAVCSPRVQPAKPRFVAETANGCLEIIGRGDEQIHLLTVWGTPFERGRAQGELLRKEVVGHTARLIELMTKDMGQPVEILDKVHAATSPHTPKHFAEELKGLAAGSGAPLEQLTRANMIGEASEWHCSLFGAWGQATRADGHVYQLRALDYAVRAEIQKHPVIAVHVPDEGLPFANIGWAGMIGSVSGINADRIALSEIGDDYDKANDTFDGMPFMYMLRDVLQFDGRLDHAIARVRATPRTTSLMYAIGDGEFGEVRALQTSHTLCNVYNPDNLEPLTKTHPRINDVVYWGMSWNVPKYDQALHDKLVEHYGHIDAKVTIEDILPSVGTGNLQAVVYDLTDLRIWVANARAAGEQGPLNAYERPFVEIDMRQVFRTAIWRALAAPRK